MKMIESGLNVFLLSLVYFCDKKNIKVVILEMRKSFL